MSRDRILFNTIGVFISPPGATGYCFSSGNSGVNLISQLQRVQSFSNDESLSLTDIKQLGQLNEIDRISLEPPTVNFSTEWIVADVSNEKKIGFYISGDQPAIKFISDGTRNDHNFFVPVAPEGVDILNWTGNCQVFQFTIAYLSSYSVNGAVGGPVTASANFECFNYGTSTGSKNVPVKAIDPTGGQMISNVLFTIPNGVSGLSNTISAIQPRGITVDIGNAGLGLAQNGLRIQSFTFSVELPRTNLTAFGSFYPYSKQVQYPAPATASVTAYIGDLVESNLQDLLCTNPDYDITINLNDPTCSGFGATAVKYMLKKAKFESQSLSDMAVDNTAGTVTLNFATNSSLQTDRGAFISGSRF